MARCILPTTPRAKPGALFVRAVCPRCLRGLFALFALFARAKPGPGDEAELSANNPAFCFLRTFVPLLCAAGSGSSFAGCKPKLWSKNMAQKKNSKD